MASELDPRERVLIALCGLNPAVLTETVWCLANSPLERPVQRLLVLTTAEGRERVREELLENGTWERLLAALPPTAPKPVLADTALCLHTFADHTTGKEIDDIGSEQASAACADQILETLRRFTENPDVEVVFSIAGGRKTMSALGALCMTLLGRDRDRLCHVLVDPPFDSPDLSPRFYFPDPRVRCHALPDGTAFAPARARTRLCDVPFVRMRHLFRSELHHLPGTFTRLVAEANRVVADTVPLSVIFEPAHCRITVRTRSVPLRPAPFALLWFLAERCRQKLPPLHGMKHLAEQFAAFCADIDTERMPEALHYDRFNSWHNPEDSAKLASLAKKAIQTAWDQQAASAHIQALFPTRKRGVYALDLKPGQINILEN